MILYDRLWETMRRKNISQYRLIKYYNFSAGQIGRLKQNMYVSTHTIDVLCKILDCQVEEIMEFRNETGTDKEKTEPVDYIEGADSKGKPDLPQKPTGQMK